MTDVERLSSIVQVRRRSVLAEAKLRRSIVRVGTAYDSDVQALSEEISALDDRIRASAKEGVEGMVSLLASFTIFTDSFRQWAVDEGYDENMKMPWYRSSTLGSEGEKAFNDFKARNVSFKKKYAKLKYPGLPSDVASDSDYGAPLPPVVPGEPGSSETRLTPKSSPLAAIGSTNTVLALVVATVAAVGGYLLLSKGSV